MPSSSIDAPADGKATLIELDRIAPAMANVPRREPPAAFAKN
jgi:hypothetical protein